MTSSGQVTIPEAKPPIAPDRALNCESEALTAHRSTRVSRPEVCIVSITAAVVGRGAACVVSSLSECGYFLSHSAEWVDTGSGGSWWLSCDMPAPTRGCLSGRVWLLGGLCGVSQRPLGLVWRCNSGPTPDTVSLLLGAKFDVVRSLVSSARLPPSCPGVRGKIPRRPRRPRLVLTSVAAHV
jgi:hypothetical protein